MSGGAAGSAAAAVTAIHLAPAREAALALLAAGVPDHHVMRTAGAGGFFLRVPRAAVPDTLSEGHVRGLLSVGSTATGRELGAPDRASKMPLGMVKPGACFPLGAATRRELSFQIRP